MLIADEFLELVTAAEDGMADRKIVDRIRPAKLAIIGGMQSEISADPVIGRDRRKVLMLNFRTCFIFQAAEEGSEEGANFIGKKTFIKRNKSYCAMEAAHITER